MSITPFRQPEGKVEISVKVCPTCPDQAPQPIANFHRHGIAADGYRSQCKTCRSAALKEWRKLHPDLTKAQQQRSDSKPRRKALKLAMRAKQREDGTAQEYRRWRRKTFPEVVAQQQRSCHLKRTYGITTEQYDTMAESQGHVCAICGRPNPSGKNLSVDHNHFTNENRELLCHRCNMIIGYCNETIDILLKAADYLRRHSEI